jgi:peptide deformylase
MQRAATGLSTKATDAADSEFPRKEVESDAAKSFAGICGKRGNLPPAIVQVGDPVLRQPAHALSVREINGKEVRKLIDRMRQAMRDAPGVGLAAPQVGVPLQLAVIEDLEEYHKDVDREELAARGRRPVPFQVIINPKIVERGGETAGFFEGCLSLSGFSAVVARALHVQVECLNERGENKVIQASGWHARILQHEIDHLAGTLYIDRMDSRTFTSLENWKQFWKGKPVSQIRVALNGAR